MSPPTGAYLLHIAELTLADHLVLPRRATFTKGRVAKGQNVLITGIGGGVALLALRLCLAAGANVFVTGGSQAKVDKAISYGAKGGAIYKDDKWPATLRSTLPKDRPYIDVVIDSAGGPITAQSIKAGLKTGGRIVCFGMTAAPKIDVTMREVLKNVDLMGECSVGVNVQNSTLSIFSSVLCFKAPRWEALENSESASNSSASTRLFPTSTRSSTGWTTQKRALNSWQTQRSDRAARSLSRLCRVLIRCGARTVRDCNDVKGASKAAHSGCDRERLYG